MSRLVLPVVCPRALGCMAFSRCAEIGIPRLLCSLLMLRKRGERTGPGGLVTLVAEPRQSSAHSSRQGFICLLPLQKSVLACVSSWTYTSVLA
eukprot:365510-Chlamydomonas_euryale.AAC.2